MGPAKQIFRVTMEQANEMTNEEWNTNFMDIVEKSPEFAKTTCQSKPYSKIEELEQAFFDALDNLNGREKLKIINRHKNAIQAVIHRFVTFKADINSEALVKFLDITQFETQLFKGIYLLKAYEKFFGFPFIMKPTDINFEDFYMALQYRCNNTIEQEIEIAMQEIKKYASEKLRSVIHSATPKNMFLS